jgi:hypothetical protein
MTMKFMDTKATVALDLAINFVDQTSYGSASWTDEL